MSTEQRRGVRDTKGPLADFTNKKVDLNYFPKEELKIFFFDEYAVPDNEKEGLKQLFKLSARGCYLEAVKKQTPGSFK